jgi:hypothetical protein
MPDAKLYVVQTTRGTVYAVHHLGSGLIWTEGSERCARAAASDKQLTIIDEQTISHAELLRLLGHEPMPVKATPSPAPAANANTLAGAVDVAKPAPAPAQPFSFDARYHWEDESDVDVNADDAIVIPKAAAPPVSNIFCSEEKVTELPSNPPTPTKPREDQRARPT